MHSVIMHADTIPQEEHRYPTVGDWQISDNWTTSIQVSSLGNWRYEFLIAFHEWIESQLLRSKYEPPIRPRDLTGSVDYFDMWFEKLRLDPKSRSEIIGNAKPESAEYMAAQMLEENLDAEPGDCPAAPYYVAHQIATGFERLMAAHLGVIWDDYEAALTRAMNQQT